MGMSILKALSPLAAMIGGGGGDKKKKKERGPRGEEVQSYKRGGKVKRTGKAKLHKGEKILPKRSRGKKR